jgi:hypothetical protein
MSGSIDSTLLGGGSGDSLLGILYGSSATASTTSPTGAVQALQSAEKNQTTDVAQTEKKPQVARDISAFTAAVQSATSVKSLLNNPTVLKVLLTANGLGDQVSYTALAQSALTSNVNDSSSLANQLSDSQWLTMAKSLNFANDGLSKIKSASEISSITDAYAEQVWRDSLDATTPGLSNALTFRAEASSVTSALQILGDSVMRDVVTTALGIPATICYQELEAQERAITTRLDVSNLQNPKFVENLLGKYMMAKATSASTASTTDFLSLAVQAHGLTV